MGKLWTTQIPWHCNYWKH